MIKIFIRYFFLFIMSCILFLFICLFLILMSRSHYYIGEEKRLKLIDKLKNDCMDGDALQLIVTYDDIYWDKNNSQCWKEYFMQCLHHREHNLSLQIPIKCKAY